MRPFVTALRSAILTLGLLLIFTSAVWADSQSYVVQPGDTLLKIAVRFGVTMDALRTANGITGDRIYAGQTLTIPDPNSPTTSPPPAATGDVIHVVQPGETLFTIGLKYGMTWTKIQAANGLTSDRVYSGQRLKIPVSGSTTTPPQTPPETPPETPPSDPPANPPPAQGSETTYTVQRGDTLARIAQRYGIAWPAIQAANNLPSDRIYVGQQLIIPSGSTAPTTGSAPPPPSGSGKRFLVDLSEQRLYAYEGDTLVRSTLISSGKARTPTVIGTFYVYLRYTAARMRGPGYDLANVPYVMYFYKGYGLHGTYWHSNFGTPMSHGCVNMPTAEAEWAYHWSTYGTPVIVQP